MTEKIIIDGENATLGRLASFSAKQALQGKEVIIVNSRKIVITGNRDFILEKYRHKRTRHGSSLKGPVIHREPEKVLKRTIRGMLPWKKGKGAKALKRIICYNDIPNEYEKSIKIKAGKSKGNKFIGLEEVTDLI
jgi:ribosomal protein uL13